jgi:hypothetical protein
VEPDDFEYEPTAHDEVLKRAQEHKAETCGHGREARKDGAMSTHEFVVTRKIRKSPKAGTGRR